MKQRSNKQPGAPGNRRPPGKNRKQEDSPDKDVHHDESRRNAFDEDVAEALKEPQKRGENGGANE